MNKQLTKKNIGIAASAALMASVAFSGSALAAKGGNSQSELKGSIGVKNTCHVEVIADDNVVLTLTSVITDKSSGDGEALNVKWSAQAQEKYKGRDLYPIGKVETAEFDNIPDSDNDGVKSVTVTETFDLCAASTETEIDSDGNAVPKYPGMSTFAKAANAETTVKIDDGHKVEGWISRCIDDPDTEYVNELETLKLAQGLCPTNTNRQDQ